MMADDVVVERSVDLEVPRGEVWNALTDPHRLSEWVGGEVVELDVRSGGRGTVRRADGATRRLSIEVVEAPSHLVLRWWPFERRSEGIRPTSGSEGIRTPDGSGGSRPPVGSGTRVEFRLEQVGRTKTLLRVRESPPLGGVESAADEGSALDERWTPSAGRSVNAIAVEVPFRTPRSNLRAVSG